MILEKNSDNKYFLCYNIQEVIQMTRAIIFSDSHNSFSSMTTAMDRAGDVKYIIHAGDVQSDVDDLKLMYPQHNIIYVKGNNDFWDRETPEERLFTLDGVRIFLTHGHNFGVKLSLSRLAHEAEKRGAQLCIFGHTHVKADEMIGSVRMYNPGSARRSYGIMELENGRFEIKTYDL